MRPKLRLTNAAGLACLCLVYAGLGQAQNSTDFGSDKAAYETCLTLAEDSPETAIDHAQSWLLAGGGGGAAHCLATAQFGAFLTRWQIRNDAA